MNILSMLNAPWAITQDEFIRIHELAIRLKEQSEVLFSKEHAQAPDNSNPQNPGYSLIGSTAVIPIVGIIVKNTDEYSQYFGEVGTRDISAALTKAENDPAVKSILFMIDSPGGTVDGTDELAAEIYDARVNGPKPIYTLADGLMTSAAYYIGSAAQRAYAINKTSHVGSIGVITTHVDFSKALEMRGIKVTHITAGKYKATGSPFKPLDRESEDVIQGRVDYFYSLFVEAVAKHRGRAVQDVLDQMADGRIFPGQKAIDAGLIDGIRTRAQVLAELEQDAMGRERNRAFMMAADTRIEQLQIKTSGGNVMDKDLEKAANERIQALEAASFERGKAAGIEEGCATASQRIVAAKTEGAKQERERIQAVEAAGAGMPAHDKLVQEMMFDGQTTGAQASERILAAEKANRESRLEHIRTSAPKPVAPATMPAPPSKDADYNPVQIARQAQAHQAEMAAKGMKYSIQESVDHVLAAQGLKVGTGPVIPADRA